MTLVSECVCVFSLCVFKPLTGLAVWDVNVLHADLLSVVGGGCAGQGENQHVDDARIAPPSAGGDAAVVVVPNLDTEEERERGIHGLLLRIILT